MVKGCPELYERVCSLMNQYGAESPDIMTAFMKLHKTGIKDGALSGKVKELIALAISICVRCDGCIAFHVHDAIKAGATHSEIVETIGVSIIMGGGPSVVYGAQALQALKECEAENAKKAEKA